MKLLIALLFSTLLSGNPVWLTDFNQAKTEASQSGKYILLNFSGSDWCAPCIRMHKEIFTATSFTDYAAKNLVLVQADFPRMKKHQLPKDQQQRNAALADQYNPKGVFPLTVLTDATGKVVKSWEGYPNESPEQFVATINTLLHGRQ